MVHRDEAIGGGAAAPQASAPPAARAEAAALENLRLRLSGLSARVGGEADALSASWGILRSQLVQGQRPWRKAQKRLLRLAGGLLALAPRIDAALSRSSRIAENAARLSAGLCRNQRHYARNQISLALLRQRLDEAKAQFLEAYRQAQQGLAALPEHCRTRCRSLDESRLVLEPLAEVLRARKARLRTGLARQRALAERIEQYQEELARETAAQQASGRLYRRLSRALARMEQRLEAETREVLAQGSLGASVAEDQRRAVREGKARLARLGEDLKSADSLARTLEESRRDLVERLERLAEPAPVAEPVDRLGAQISELHAVLGGDEADDGPPVHAWLEPSGWFATDAASPRGEPVPSAAPATPCPAPAQAGLEELLARLDAQERELAEARRLAAEARNAAQAAEKAARDLQERAEGQDKLLEEYRRLMREAEREARSQAARLARVVRERDLAELRADRTRQSLAYQLGDALQRGFSSFAALRALPRELAALRRETRRREAALILSEGLPKAQAATPDIPAATPAASTAAS